MAVVQKKFSENNDRIGDGLFEVQLRHSKAQIRVNLATLPLQCSVGLCSEGQPGGLDVSHVR
jgi:hypothetical protein